MEFKKPEIRIGVGGNVDAGKSSFVGVVTKGILDDGRGSARNLIMRYTHERESGRTSSIVQHYIQLPDKIIELTDLAGHEKYLRTTISGISGCLLDYIAIVINCNVGIQQMTREHINIVYTLKLPMFIVYTKIDMCPANIYQVNLNYIKMFYKKKMNLDIEVINNQNELDNFIMSRYIYGSIQCPVPVFPISNVTGAGVEILKLFINSLKQYTDYSVESSKPVEFYVNRTYAVSGIGLVISGVIKQGTVKRGDILYLGPNSDGFVRDKNNIIIEESHNLVSSTVNNYYKVVIKNIHDNFQNNVEYLSAGHSGCVNIKSFNNKNPIKRNMIKKGMRILSVVNSVRQFKARIRILHNPSTITVKYQPTLHCAGISQSVQIIEMDKEHLRSYDEANVKFKFMYKPEFIQAGDIFIFREGTTKGIGKVLEIS